MRTLVMTVIGPDRPGLVEELSSTISSYDGNWLESRMAQLSGHFTGILRLSCPESGADNLLAALRQLDGLTVHVVDELRQPERPHRHLQFDVMGNDRPGIVRQLSTAIAQTGGNVEELNSDLESAPHAGHPVFRATGTVTVPQDFDETTLASALESLGPDLSVSISREG